MRGRAPASKPKEHALPSVREVDDDSEVILPELAAKVGRVHADKVSSIISIDNKAGLNIVSDKNHFDKMGDEDDGDDPFESSDDEFAPLETIVPAHL